MESVLLGFGHVKSHVPSVLSFIEGVLGWIGFWCGSILGLSAKNWIGSGFRWVFVYITQSKPNPEPGPTGAS